MNYISSFLIKKALDGDKVFPTELYDALKMLPENKETKLSEELNFLLTQLETGKLENTLSDNADFCFNHILIKNFRRYGETKEGNYFGIRMSEEMPPTPSEQTMGKTYEGLVLLGDNGVGKSSVFGAIEFWAKRSISEAEYREIEDQRWFYQHNEKEPEILVVTSDGKNHGLKDIGIWQSSYDVARFFISENSILESASFMNENGEEGKNWYRYFCYMLSIHPFLIEFAFDDDNDKIYKRITNALKKLQEWTAELSIVDEELDSIHCQIVDGSIILTEGERNGLRKYQEILSSRLITWENNFNLAEFEKELKSVEIDSFQYIPAIHTFSLSCNDIRTRLEKLPTDGNNFFKKENLRNLADNVNKKLQLKNELQKAVNNCMQRLKNMLDDNIEYDKVILRKNRLTTAKKLKEKIETVQIDILFARLQEFRKNLAESIQKYVKDIIDEEFKQAIRSVFDKTFINENRESFNFDITSIDNNEINIEVNKIPVHKYFNTFRYRLFCLTMQVMINLKIMKKDKFSFPIIFDDVFYANDYKNKQQLYKFFKILRDKAFSFLAPEQKFQILFFTHDEQLVATLQKDFNPSFKFGRMIEVADFEKPAVQKDFIVHLSENTKYLNLYFPIYEPFLSYGQV